MKHTTNSPGAPRTGGRGRKATGSVSFTRYADGTGAWFGRISDGHGHRVRVKLGTWPNSPQGEARAKEAAAGLTERVYEQGAIALLAKKKPKPGSVATAPEDPAAWWDAYFKRRDELGMTSIHGTVRTHITPNLNKPWSAITPKDCERLRDLLDAKILRGELEPKTASNAWGVFTTAAKAASGKWTKKYRGRKPDVRRELQVIDRNPCEGIEGPDYDKREHDKSLQILYPREVLAVAACERVPLVTRRRIVLAAYLKCRGGELKALTWEKLDLERGVAIIDQAYDRERKRLKKTKTGQRGARPQLKIETTLLPLLRKMHEESGGVGAVIAMPMQKHWARELRAALRTAGVTRPALFTTTETSKNVRFHDLKATGLSWMSIRGDSPGDIQYAGGHTGFEMTQRYIDHGARLHLLPDETVFPALPECLLGSPAPAAKAKPNGSGGNGSNGAGGTRLPGKSADQNWPEKAVGNGVSARSDSACGMFDSRRLHSTNDTT